MVKLWIKTYLDNRIIKQTEVILDEKFTYSRFHEYIEKGCYELDEATPVIIKSHLFNFAKYNMVKFTKEDFLESIDFDKMIVENLDK